MMTMTMTMLPSMFGICSVKNAQPLHYIAKVQEEE